MHSPMCDTMRQAQLPLQRDKLPSIYTSMVNTLSHCISVTIIQNLNGADEERERKRESEGEDREWMMMVLGNGKVEWRAQGNKKGVKQRKKE